MRLKISQLSKSYDFTKGLLISSAAFSAVAICFYFFDLSIGIGIASGVLIISASDIPGNNKHHLYGMLISTLLALVNFIAIHFAFYNDYLLFASLGILVFLNAYISIYGFRASLIAFSGLMTITLSFAASLMNGNVWLNALYIIIGGLWYILLSLVFGKFRTSQYSDVLLNECMELTAAYLQTRVAAINPDQRQQALEKQLNLQNEINEKHESLRELLLHQRQHSGGMYSKRRQLLLFIELIDIHEFAVANPFRFKKYDSGGEAFKRATSEIAEVMNAIAETLLLLASKPINANTKSPHPNLESLVNNAKNTLLNFENSVDPHEHRNEILQLRNLLDYVQNQYKKIVLIEGILRKSPAKNTLEVQQRDHLKFITSQDYSPKLWVENLSLKSPIFKHSLRLVVTILTGYLIGVYFEIHNAYWIMLTIIVIMRPGYVLTKDRTKQRIIGTIIGGIVALCIVLLTTNMIVYMLITFIALTLSITLVQHNYKISAAFITLTIVFIYAMIAPNALEIIQFRITDTLIGAALASVANIFLWPSWEKEGIRSLILEAIQSNKNYLKEVRRFYHEKKDLSTSYKVSRKQTFISMGNLHAGFQRMTQEPKKQQQQLDKIYEIVVTLNSLLAATASLGTYTQIHHTTDASEYFDTYIYAILNELSHCEALILQTEFTPDKKLDLEKAKTYLQQTYDTLYQQKIKEEEKAENLGTLKDMEEQLKEVRIITEQLEWQYTLSKNLHIRIKRYLLENKTIQA